jgi:hypothetical protein
MLKRHATERIKPEANKIELDLHRQMRLPGVE